MGRLLVWCGFSLWLFTLCTQTRSPTVAGAMRQEQYCSPVVHEKTSRVTSFEGGITYTHLFTYSARYCTSTDRPLNWDVGESPFQCPEAGKSWKQKLVHSAKEADEIKHAHVQTQGVYNSRPLLLKRWCIVDSSYPDETRRVQKFHIGIKIGSHKGFTCSK